MIGLGSTALKIYVAMEAQDLRKSFQGLTEVALGHLAEQLSREALFVFSNRIRTRIKLLYFDGTGLWVATKRHVTQCPLWFVSRSALPLALPLPPSIWERNRGLRCGRWSARHDIRAFGRQYNPGYSSVDVRSCCLRECPRDRTSADREQCLAEDRRID
jgi:transposase